MAKLNKLLILVTIFVSLFLNSCQKESAVGEDNQILVVAEEKLFLKYQEQLNSVFNQTIMTPSDENAYTLTRITLEELKSRKIYKNLIFLTDVDQKSVESDFINGMLSDKIMEGVRNGEYYFAMQEELFARNESVLILMASTNDHLSKYLVTYKDKLFRTIHDRNLAVIRERIYEKKVDLETAKKLLDKYNVEVVVPDGYELVDEGINTTFFQLRRSYPADRWLTVIKGQYDTNLNMQDNIVKLRDLASKEYGDSIWINKEFTSFESDTTFDQNGVLARGLWEYKEGGGPFMSYAFIKNNSFYLIDGAVYAPGMDKYPHLNQLEVLAKLVKIK